VEASNARSQKALHDCMRKFLTGRGYSKSQMTVLPECTKQDWPSPFTSQGECVHYRGKMIIFKEPAGLSF